MARFDVYPGVRAKGFLLDCQSDLLSHLETRAVVPLFPAAGLPAATKLNPLFEVQGSQVVMATHLLFAIPVERLQGKVASLADRHLPILSALDMLLTGH